MKPTYDLPDGVAEILAKSLQVGAGTGMSSISNKRVAAGWTDSSVLTCTWTTGTCGLLFGATAGIVRGTTPILFSLVTGLQWFGLGSVYYGTFISPPRIEQASTVQSLNYILTCPTFHTRHEKASYCKTWSWISDHFRPEDRSKYHWRCCFGRNYGRAPP